MLEKKRVVIGSAHFVFEDEKCRIRPEYQQRFDELPLQYSHLYLAVDNVLEAVLCIEDPVREEAKQIIRELKREGFTKNRHDDWRQRANSSGDRKTDRRDEYHAEVLPEDKANFVQQEKKPDAG